MCEEIFPTIFSTVGIYNPTVATSIFPVFSCESKDIPMRNVQDFGTGFLFEYSDYLFFVTADHVVRSQDHEDGFRGKTAFTPWIYSSHHDDKLQTKMIPILETTFFSSANLHDVCSFFPHRLPDAIENIASPSEEALNDEEIAEAAVPDLHDITYAFVPKCLEGEIFNIFCPCHPYIKIPLKTELIKTIKNVQVGRITEHGVYHAGGFIDSWLSAKDNKYHTCVRFLQGLSFLSRQEKDEAHPDELVWMLSPDIFTEKELKGISGAPVFDEEERLCGVVARTLHTNHTVAVYPIENLLKLMDYEIQIRNLPPLPS